MSNSATDPNRLFMINTDVDCYRRSRPNEKDGSPFFTYWQPEGYAYVTPAPMPYSYDKALAELTVGDIVFAYEDKTGIVAVGEVLERADLVEYRGGTALHPNPNEIVKKVRVAWDTSIFYPTSAITAAGTTPRGGKIPLWMVSAPKMLTILKSLLVSAAVAKREAEDTAAQNAILANPTLTDKDKQCLRQARIGQGVFRANVFQKEPRCRVSGVTDPRHLRASHIKPWCHCTGAEHLDGNNGLMLAPHVDHLFDSGLISFSDDGEMLLSCFLDRSVLHA